MNDFQEAQEILLEHRNLNSVWWLVIAKTWSVFANGDDDYDAGGCVDDGGGYDDGGSGDDKWDLRKPVKKITMMIVQNDDNNDNNNKV